jgi:hypothetical protein
MKTLTEGLDYQDMKGQVEPKITVDEYSAKMGRDEDIVTVTFVVNNSLAASDLVSWLELGYDFVLDATTSTGEVKKGKYLVFMELKRRSSCVKQILQVLSDMTTITAIPLEEWTITIDDTNYEPDLEAIKIAMATYPQQYKDRIEKEKEIAELQEIAGINTVRNVPEEQDSEIKDFKAMAGL